MAGNPDLLVLDEPTAALGHAETGMVLDLLRELRSQGTAMLLITHQLEHVFDLADRVAVLRHGQLVADVSPREVHPDDLVALQSGIEVDSTASRQLHRLSSLVEQLSEVTKLRVPSFVVTIAGLMTWQGVMLRVLGDTGSYNLTDDTITSLVGTFFSAAVGWTLAAVAVGAVVLATWFQRYRRLAAGLPPAPLRNDVARLSVLTSSVLAAVVVFNNDRGVPLAVVIFVGLVVVFDTLTRRTVLGRHMLAVGGNVEAARRAGIRVDRVRATAFVLASTLAAAGGILGAARQLSVTKSDGGGDLLLLAIGGAVIGGTSLFGGRGSAWSAFLGALVIGSIANGMDLLGHPSDVKFMVTDAVLLLAASVDAVSRRGRQAAGRA